ncbi:MAG: TerD family protein [Candidatus Competibacteraceae bacterium]|nr:TerD family protein [Candidatus Competibacteraceae bacterium]
MKTLTKGANAVLTRSGAVRINLSWKAPRIELDASCFAIDSNGKTPNDAWFLFYNQPTSPGGAIQFFRLDARQAEFTIQLDQLPADIQKCVFAATLNQSSFSDVTNATITATPQNGEMLQFNISGATEEQALIFAEIYRHGLDWKMRAIGQGFKGGLQPLAEHYGIEVADEPTPPSESSLPCPASDHAPSPDSPADRQQDAPTAGQRGAGFLKKLLISVVTLLLLASASILALAYYYPQALFTVSPQLSSLLHPLINGAASITSSEISDTSDVSEQAVMEEVNPKSYVESTCPFTDEKVFERYHELGKNYTRIVEIINDSNQNLADIREDLKKLDLGCSSQLVEKNRQEIARLEQLPIQGWMEESTQLNTCASIMTKKIDAEVNIESRPIVLSRLMKNADRSRNLGSDLTDISRDLSYLNNKKARLIEGYRSNLAACAK